MAVVHVSEETQLQPEVVLQAARDFSERRAQLWPDVHLEHFQVHELGDTFADVTEGNPEFFGFIWERLRYDWSQPGSVKGTVIDSNIFKAGSTWEMRATPRGDGSLVEVIGLRYVKGLKGVIIWLFILVGVGRSTVASHLHHFLSVVEESELDSTGDRNESASEIK